MKKKNSRKRQPVDEYEEDVYICQSCGTIVSGYLKECPECGGTKNEDIRTTESDT